MTMNLVEGRRRLRLLLNGLCGGFCVVGLAAVLVLYGSPYNPIWWAILAALAAASFVVPGLCVPLFEWALKGYLDTDDSDKNG